MMILLFVEISSFGQKMTGVGAELSILSVKPNFRMWLSRSTGFELFGGVSAELSDQKPNDYEGGLKYLHTFNYNRTNRTYLGLVGKLNRVQLDGTNLTTNVPVAGLLIGVEWFSKRNFLKGLSAELGYQYGKKEYEIFSNIGQVSFGKRTYDEFPLILNIRYAFYKKKK
jgi:hypothetical protein